VRIRFRARQSPTTSPFGSHDKNPSTSNSQPLTAAKRPKKPNLQAGPSRDAFLSESGPAAGGVCRKTAMCSRRSAGLCRFGPTHGARRIPSNVFCARQGSRAGITQIPGVWWPSAQGRQVESSVRGIKRDCLGSGPGKAAKVAGLWFGRRPPQRSKLRMARTVGSARVVRGGQCGIVPISRIGTNRVLFRYYVMLDRLVGFGSMITPIRRRALKSRWVNRC